LLPDQSTPSRPRAVDTISAARPANEPCSLGLPGGVKESRANDGGVGNWGFSARTDAVADVGGAGTASDTWRNTDGAFRPEASRECLSSSVVSGDGASIGTETVDFETVGDVGG